MEENKKKETKEYKEDRKRTNLIIYIFVVIVFSIFVVIIGKCIIQFLNDREDNECYENKTAYQMQEKFNSQISELGRYMYHDDMMDVKDELTKEPYVFVDTYDKYINYLWKIELSRFPEKKLIEDSNEISIEYKEKLKKLLEIKEKNTWEYWDEYLKNNELGTPRDTKYTKDFFETKKIIMVTANGTGILPSLKKVEEVQDSVNIDIEEHYQGALANMEYMVFIPIDLKITNANISYESIDTRKYTFMDRILQTKDKPIIYLYPTEEKEIKVKLGYEDNIICSYPKYINEWKVLAKPNGKLKDLHTKRNLYALYYESKRIMEAKIEEDGFVIKGEDSSNFLEEKLKILGLNEKETEEFIIYWLPKLEKNKYNYIRFERKDEIEKNMPLTISPNPDTLIRVSMNFKGLERKINVKEQKLEKTKRIGFVAVEWGGTEIK